MPRTRTIAPLVLGLFLVTSACAAADEGADTPDAAVTTVAEQMASESTISDEAAPHGDEEATHDESADHGDEEAAHDESADHGDEEAADHGDGTFDRMVPVVMTDMAFSPTRLGVVAGETIRFEVRNEGAIVHEFRLSNAHRIEEHIASGHEDHHGDSEDGHHEETDIVLELDAGESAVIDVTFPEDTTIFTEIACLLPGHYEAGMKADLIYA